MEIRELKKYITGKMVNIPNFIGIKVEIDPAIIRDEKLTQLGL